MTDTPFAAKSPENNTTLFAEFENTLHDLADASAQTILPHFRSKLDIDEKHGKGMFDPVTVADRSAEEIMRKIVEERFADHGIIGEEFPDKDPKAEHCWIFDPIDGTRAFIIGAPTWGTLIGLAHNGSPQLGMMNQPFTNERYWGGPRGAFYRDPKGETHKLSTSDISDLDQAVLSSTGPEYFVPGSGREQFEKLTEQTRMTRYGYDCYAYCLLAMGLLDVVAEAGLETYDIAPLVPLVRAAGGIVTTWDNGDPTPGGYILASANQHLHDKALAVLQQTA